MKETNSPRLMLRSILERAMTGVSAVAKTRERPRISIAGASAILVLSETILRLALGILLAWDSLLSFLLSSVIPAKAGIQGNRARWPWIPAFAGMTT